MDEDMFGHIKPNENRSVQASNESDTEGGGGYRFLFHGGGGRRRPVKRKVPTEPVTINLSSEARKALEYMSRLPKDGAEDVGADKAGGTDSTIPPAPSPKHINIKL